MDASSKDSGVYSFGQYRLDPLRRTLTAGGTEIRLVPRAFDLLVYFVENPGRVIEKDELISAIWVGQTGDLRASYNWLNTGNPDYVCLSGKKKKAFFF